MLRKILPLEQKLIGSISRGDLQEVESYIIAIKESKDIPAPSIDAYDASDEYFPTSLMKAAGFGNAPVVELLLKYGADTSITNAANETVLDIVNRVALQWSFYLGAKNGNDPTYVNLKASGFNSILKILSSHNTKSNNSKNLLSEVPYLKTQLKYPVKLFNKSVQLIQEQNSQTRVSENNKKSGNRI